MSTAELAWFCDVFCSNGVSWYKIALLCYCIIGLFDWSHILCLIVFPITVLAWSDPGGWDWPKYLIRVQSSHWLAANLNYIQILPNVVSKKHLKDTRPLSKFHLFFFRDIFTSFCLILFWRSLSMFFASHAENYSVCPKTDSKWLRLCTSLHSSPTSSSPFSSSVESLLKVNWITPSFNYHTIVWIWICLSCSHHVLYHISSSVASLLKVVCGWKWNPGVNLNRMGSPSKCRLTIYISPSPPHY